jgi:hypothetical protein
MPPRRSARAAPEKPSPAYRPNPEAAAAALPPAALLPVLDGVPVDTRLRCREVCRAWRDALADPAAWAVVDLSADTGPLA